MRHTGRVVSKTMIIEHVWDHNFDPETNIVEARICRLRDKVDRGYRFVPVCLHDGPTDACGVVGIGHEGRCSDPIQIEILWIRGGSCTPAEEQILAVR